ncbi:SIR2 family protein [Micromonospora sp. LOL_024]|uniref:SIR2 family protein n=1 Tax=Micromonospora sp. LOL_024 TaxID=3345412 RepID=UPI003A8BEDCD
MVNPVPAAGGALDSRIALATSVHAQPGVYALLLGSGTSTGAGVPTGWGVVTALAAKVAAAAGDQVPTDFDADAWWNKHGDGQPLGYSGLLASLASTPAARRAILAGFFEPTEDERQQGLKVPGAAHRAIAALVARGAVRVILTTNFDRLIEQALEAEGVFPQVIATPTAIDGMEPLAHARCTVIKLHGDYARIDQLNTVEELSHYPSPLKALLDRVLDEYGLIINGWSGDWDHALVAAIEGTRSRRYPLYWSSFAALGTAAQRLVAQHRAHVIGGVSADQFFPDLLSRLQALDTLADPPLTKTLAIARLKRVLPDPIKHIELRDLLDAEVQRLRTYLAGRPQMAPGTDGQAVQDAHDEIRQRCDTLLHLVAHGVYLDRDRQHTALWTWVIEQLMRARPQPDGQFHQFWVSLHHYPALLALQAASLSAVAAQRDDVLLRLLREPTWRDRGSSEWEVPALDALHTYRVLDHDVINSFPRWNGTKWLYPRSRLLKDELRKVFLPLLGDEESYQRLFHRTEYRVALAQKRFQTSYRSAPGEFIGDGQWRREGLIWDADFRAHADLEVWGWTTNETGTFNQTLTELAAELQQSRRYG